METNEPGVLDGVPGSAFLASLPELRSAWGSRENPMSRCWKPVRVAPVLGIFTRFAALGACALFW